MSSPAINYTVDQDRVRYPGSASFDPTFTSYGYFNSEQAFVDDSPRAIVWATTKLGYPIVDIELTVKNLYACFEGAILEIIWGCYKVHQLAQIFQE